MSADLEANCTNESQDFEIAARCFYELFYNDYALFKGGKVYYWLTYSYESAAWQCDCPDYTPQKPCPHSIAAQKSLPVPPRPIVLE